MALCFHYHSSPFTSLNFTRLSRLKTLPKHSSLSVRSLATSNRQSEDEGSNPNVVPEKKKTKRLSEQSSWEAKDSEGKDYLYRLGAEADNMNIAVGARAGVIDDLFTGNFLGKDCKFSLIACIFVQFELSHQVFLWNFGNFSWYRLSGLVVLSGYCVRLSAEGNQVVWVSSRRLLYCSTFLGNFF